MLRRVVRMDETKAKWSCRDAPTVTCIQEYERYNQHPTKKASFRRPVVGQKINATKAT